MKISPSTPKLFEFAFSVGKKLDSIYNTKMDSRDFDNTVRELQITMTDAQNWPIDQRKRFYLALQGIPYDNLDPEEVMNVLEDLRNCNL